jgi:predicted dehydrogenase
MTAVSSAPSPRPRAAAKVGVVGCGQISGAHLRAWKKTDGFAVAGVFDLNRELAQKRAAEYGVPRIFDTVDQLLAECDVVDVCTPPHTHARLARDVLAAGRHLLIEKPVVIEVTDWEGIVAAASSSTGKLAVIHNLKFAQGVRTAKQWVDQGRIGDVIRVQREFLTSAATDRMLVGDKHWSHKLPGGRWFETLPHELYLTHWFAGPLELASVAITHTERAPSGAPADEVAITLRGERALGTIHFSAHCEVNRRVFTVQGTHGHISVDILSDQASLVTIKDGKWKRAVGQPVLAAGQTLLGAVSDRSRYGLDRLRGESPHSRVIRAFAQYVRGHGDAPTPMDEIDYVVRHGDKIGRTIDAQLRAMGVVPGSERSGEAR